MTRLLALLLVLSPLFFAGASHAETGPLRPHDFAYGMEISLDSVTSGTSPTYAVELPIDVYEKVIWPTLHDVLAFNAAGQRIPFRLEHKPWAKGTTDVSVPFHQYVIQGDALQGAGAGEGTLLEVRTANGQVSFRYAKAGAQEFTALPEGQKKRQELLLDLGEDHPPVHELRLDWDSAAQVRISKENVTAIQEGAQIDDLLQVTVEGSRDLQQWWTVKSSWNLARLKFEGESLVRDTIPLNGEEVRYLRLRVLGDEAPRIKVLHVASRKEKRSEVIPQWLAPRVLDADASEQARNARVRNAQVYDLKGPFPVDRIRVVLPSENTLFRLTIESRPTVDAAWETRGGGTVYRAQFTTGSLQEDVITFPVTKHPLWRIGVESGGGELPQVMFGWVPHRLVFMPNGPAPYTLVYGRAEIEATPGGLENFDQVLKAKGIKEVPQHGTATLQSAKVLGGPEMLLKQPAVPLWKQASLWALLILIVLAVAWMAWRLYGELRQIES